MKETSTRFERFCTSWKFFLVLIALQFVLMPMATKGFRFEEAGQIVFTTLGLALINRFYPYSFVFQWMALALIVALLFFRDRIGRFFSAYVGCCYLLYAIIQSIAVTNKYGVSVVTVNLVMMLFVAFVWFRDSWKGEDKYTFSNLNWKTAWLVPVAFFCLWFPMNLQNAKPDFNPAYLFSGFASLAFCPMTPVFLILLTLCRPTINMVTYRVTAMVGLIIGIYNMGQFANPTGFYLGIYHLPLLLISLYALLSSRQLK